MYKIDVTIVEADNKYTELASFQYLAAIVPIVGDLIMYESRSYLVVKRTLITDNHNFVIIKVVNL